MKRDLGSLLDDLEPHKPEKQLKITRDKASADALSKIIKYYEAAFAYDFTDVFDWFVPPTFKKPKLKVPNIKITPQMITEFSVRCYGYSESANYGTATGLYLTALIQKSYLQGNNNFVIETNGLPVAHSLMGLGAHLAGKKENPIKILVHGDLSMNLGLAAENISVAVQGDAGFVVAQRAKNSEFVLDGMLVGCGAFSENCVFKSPRKNVLQAIKSVAVITNATLYWIDKKGNDVLYAKVTKHMSK